MNHGPLTGILAALVLGATIAAGAGPQPVGRKEASDAQGRSVSSSKQFYVYSNDMGLRVRVSSLCEEVKSQILTMLGTKDTWKFPIVISIRKAETKGERPVQVTMYQTPEGQTVQIDARIGDNPAAVHLQKQIVRAVFLELMYRNRAPVKGGQSYAEAPWWVVEGALSRIQQEDLGADSRVYQGLLEANRVPPLADVLENRDEKGAPIGGMDAAYARCLMGLLLEQSGGRVSFLKFLEHWPDTYRDPTNALLKDFPALATSSNALQKWWTLNIARLSAADRYRGLTVSGTDKALNALLKWELVDPKTGQRRSYTLKDYEVLSKTKTAKPVLENAHAGVVAMGVRANALMRPVLSGYEQVLALMIRGKTRGLAEKISEVETLRKSITKRSVAISDYLNWYEATQMGVRSNAFIDFFKVADELSEKQQTPATKEISEYLDKLEAEF